MGHVWLVHVVCAAAYLALAVFVLARGASALVNRACAAIPTCFFVWSSCLAVSHHPWVTRDTAALFYAIGSVAWASFASIAVAFVAAFSKPELFRRWPFWAALIVPPAIVIGFQWAGLLAADYVPRPWGYAYVWREAATSYFFFAYYNVYMVGALATLFRASWRDPDPIRKRQARIISSWAVLPLLLSSVTDVILPRLGIYTIPNMAPDFTIIWAFALVYALKRYRLLEITPSFAADKIVATMSEALLLLDASNVVVWANPSARLLFDRDSASIVGGRVDALFGAGSRAVLEQTLARSRVAGHDLVLVRGDGEERFVDLSVVEIRNDEKAVVARVCVAADVTHRRRAEDALRRARDELETRVAERTEELRQKSVSLEREVGERKLSEARYRSLIDNMQEGLWVLDASDRTSFVNVRLSEILGYSPSELGARTLPELVSGDSATTVARALASARTGKATHFDAAVRTKSGATVHVIAQVGPLVGDESGYAGCIVTVVDVTERRAMQAQLARSDRMASLGLLAAGVGHEINNPLTWLLGNLREVSQNLQAPNDARLPIAIAEALEGAERIREIVQDLRHFSRAEHAATSVDPRLAIDAATKLAKHAFKFGATITIEHGDVPNVLADQGRLTQVFSNLFVNAAQAIAERERGGGEIRVRSAVDGDLVVVTVKDDGVGIAADELDRIFDPFHSTKEGVGLGLAICHEIVAAYGGTITAASTLGEGTTMTVRLPIDRTRRAAPTATKTASRPATTGARVLVIDDEPALARVVERMLRGHHVTVVESAEAAERVLAGGASFDVVLCDVMMPGTTGTKFVDELRRSRPALASRVVFMTGGAVTASARSGLSEAKNAVLLKPFTEADVVDLVTAIQSERGPYRGESGAELGH